MKKNTLRHTPLRILLLMLTVFAVNIGIIQVSNAMATSSHTIIRSSSFVIGNLRYFKLAGNEDADGVAVAWAGNTDIDTLFSSSESVESVDISIPSSPWNLDVDTSITHPEINDAPSEKEDINAPLPKLAIDAQVTYVDKTYTVKAVAPSGFRFCTFSSITLPQTIDEIGKEAFYCCTNLTEIQLPKGITAISDSCFMDCRSLANVYFSKDDGGRTNVNSTITSIGNHAFTNCVSLVGFNCPSSLTSIGRAAFQKCSKMMSFFFPSKNAAAFTNEISVGEYAFSDCGSMTLCYFEENLVSVGKYAFAQCDKLMLYYTGSTVPNLGENWRKKHVATDKSTNKETYTNSGGTSVYIPGQLSDDFVPININNGVIKSDNQYPGLYFTIQSTDIKINCTTTKNINLEETNPGDYASIFKFDTPDHDETGYYTVSTGALTIPANVKVGDTYYPVKVIQTNAFARNEDLKNLSFATNSNLIQICHHAFVGCANLASIDFSNANSLEEISYQVFQAEDADTNTSLKGTLTMPSNLKYLGYRSFYNFKNATDLALNDGLQFIGKEAFANFGASTSGGTCDLILPTSLNDKATYDVQPFPEAKNFAYAVARNAFKGAKALKTVKVNSENSDWTADDTFYTNSANRMSLFEGAFSSCTKLLRFETSPRVFKLCNGLFEGSTNMKELLLTGKCAEKNEDARPWGNGEASIFKSGSYPDLVIYVLESSDPKQCRTPFGKEGWKWNTDQGLINYFTSNNDRLYRRTVPTYYNVNWRGNAIKYAELETISNILCIKNQTPLTSPDFSKNMVAYITKGEGNIITHCYVNSAKESIDLATYSSFNAKVIGECAFTNNGNTYPGKRIRLPNGITEIRERAFYRSNSTGVTEIAKSTDSLANIGTCSLPELTRLERLAFYNNSFTSVSIAGNSLSFLGNTVFACEKANASIEKIIANDLDNDFKVINNGIYYVGSGGKTLLYQAAKAPEENPSLTIDSGTVAIGPKALARASYKTITIPSSVTTIYGTAFGGSRENNKDNWTNNSLETIIFQDNSELKYIGATVRTSEGDFPTSFDTMDGGYYDAEGHGGSYGEHLPTSSAFGPFYSCTKLKTFDFTKLTSLERISYAAFQNCTSLEEMTGDLPQKHYYSYAGGKQSDTTTWSWGAPCQPNNSNNNNGVLDLSECKSILSISRYAFGESPKIKYVHLPELYGKEDPKFCLGYDPTDDFASYSKSNMGSSNTSNVFNGLASGYKIFVGEKACIAHPTVGSERSNTNGSPGRYPAGRAFPNTNSANIYYYVDGSILNEDIFLNNTDIHYWTKRDGSYLLFDGKSGTNIKPYQEVQAYFAS